MNVIAQAYISESDILNNNYAIQSTAGVNRHQPKVRQLTPNGVSCKTRTVQLQYIWRFEALGIKY